MEIILFQCILLPFLLNPRQKADLLLDLREQPGLPAGPAVPAGRARRRGAPGGEATSGSPAGKFITLGNLKTYTDIACKRFVFTGKHACQRREYIATLILFLKRVVLYLAFFASLFLFLLPRT